MTTPNVLAAASLTPGLLNNASLMASGEGTVYTVPTGKAVKVTSASIANTTASAVTISVSIVPSGGTAGAANRVISTYSLAAFDALTQEFGLGFLKGAMLGEGTFISVNAGTASAVTMSLSGVLIA